MQIAPLSAIVERQIIFDVTGDFGKMEVEIHLEHPQLDTAEIVATLLREFSAVTDYRALRDSLPRKLASLLHCRGVLLYQRFDETLQFAAGAFDDAPGWSAALLAVAHINPIALTGNLLEARAWRARQTVMGTSNDGSLPAIAAPLLYRQRAVGVLTAFRGATQQSEQQPQSDSSWQPAEAALLDAVSGVVALLLENTRLLERDRERIHELALLNSISSQLNGVMYERERALNIICQRAKEITGADLIGLIIPDSDTTSDSASWLSPVLRDMLLGQGRKQRDAQINPLIIERPGDEQSAAYLKQLPEQIKTFFSVPLLISENMLSTYGQGIGKLGGMTFGSPKELVLERMPGVEHDGSAPAQEGAHVVGVVNVHAPKTLGIIVGAYHRPWKLRREERILLQVLAGQASAVLENIHLMSEVIAARNEARKLLRQVLDDQRLKALILESVPSGLITFDLAGRITTFNRAAGAILGYHPHEALGQPLQTIFNTPIPMSSLDPETVLSGSARPSSPQEGASRPAQPTISETRLTLARGTKEIVLDFHFVPLRNDQHERIGTLATFNDVTIMHRLEEEKRRLDRLATLGEMAASVAHEVRNPLASIKTSIQMLQADLAGGLADAETQEDAQESLLVASKEIERLDSIVRDLLLFSKEHHMHCVMYNLVELCRQVLHMVQPQCALAEIEIHQVYHEIPAAYIDVAQIEQVLLNLFTNAIQAMPEGGILTVASRVIAAPIEELSAQPFVGESLHPNDLHAEQNVDRPEWIELSVADTGVGIASDQLENIFQPFFTTKAHGIGLGLPISRRIIEDHRGHIRVGSQPGFGTTISICLPIYEG
jgi:signal transduction histidine kinase